MKVAPLIAVALILCIAFPCPIQAKKKPKPKFCVGKDGNQYKVGTGYDDNDGKACVHYKCVKKKKKFVMKKGKCVEDGEWSSWSSWSACSSTCGSATKTRERTCSSPAPSNGGNPCSGPEEQVEECSNPSCGPDMNVKVDSLELNVQSLNDSVQTLQTTMLSVLELMTTMQAASNKQGTCMSDLSSSDCPDSAPGKVGVVAHINTNKAGISTNKAGVTSAKADINTNKAGINTNKAGMNTNKADINTNKAGIMENKAAIAAPNVGGSTMQTTTLAPTTVSTITPSGSVLIYADVNYQYYKVPVPASSKMLSALILSTCNNFNMKPQCFEKYFADDNCVQAPSTSIHSTHPRGMSQILCSTTRPQDCASTLNMFWYMNPDNAWESGSACGATKAAGFCSTGKHYTSTSDMQYFAACLKPVTTVLLHTDANYKYYKVPVPNSFTMSSTVVERTCLENGMTPLCLEASYADHKCVQAPSNPPYGIHPRAISKILCDTIFPADCASTLNMFWYTIDSWHSGSACGATKAGFCSHGKDYTSTSDMQYFAACLKPVTGWIIIQRRGQFGNAEDYFYKDFKDYENGFGSVDGELWIGLKNLAALTKDGEWELQVDLTDWDDKKYHAKYGTFSVGPAPTYTLHVGGFKDGESTLGDSMDYHNGQAFSARDKDQDANSDGSCAVGNQGGWWYNLCHQSNLNGLNFAEQKTDGKGLSWYYGKSRGDNRKTWKASVMKIKRVKV